MSLRIRGQEAKLKISVDGKTQKGSFVKVPDWTVTPRTDLIEKDYCGEDESDLDIQHHGFDIGFSVDVEDFSTVDLLTNIVERERNHQQHPKVTIQVQYTAREPGLRGRVEVYTGVFIKEDEHGAGGRKEYVRARYSAKAKRQAVITA